MRDLHQLKQEIKGFIVRRLRLTDVSPESIGDADPLFGGGLDLDSVDLLDLVVGVEKEYGIRIASAAEGREILASVNSLAEHISRFHASASGEISSARRANTARTSGGTMNVGDSGQPSPFFAAAASSAPSGSPCASRVSCFFGAP